MASLGLSFTGVSAKAKLARQSASLRTSYWDWSLRDRTDHYFWHSGTPPEDLLFAFQAAVHNAMAGVSRGAKLASQLLAFGRRQALEPRTVNVGRLIAGMDEMLRRSLGETIEVETITAGGLWNCMVDPTQIENAILNLAINARDAMPMGASLLSKPATRSSTTNIPGPMLTPRRGSM